MSLKLTNLRRPVEESETGLPHWISERLGIPADEIQRWKILRKSLDARQRRALQFVYTVEVVLPDEVEAGLASGIPDVFPFTFEPFDNPPVGTKPVKSRPVVVGSGPAGLLAGYYLAKRGYCPLIIERGQPVKERVPAIRAFDRGGEFERENNYLFGEGGAGCFSDGKLTCRMSGSDVDWVLQSFIDCGGKESILYEQRPHLGSNKLPMICRNFRRKIEQLGGEYLFNTRMESLEIIEGQVQAVLTSSGRIPTEHLVLGIGHSARDSYEMLHDLGVSMQPKAFQLGLRIEQPQAHVNAHKYGRDIYREILGAADYTLIAKANKRGQQRDVYSFCMCAGGIVIPSISEPGLFCSNGMSNSRHDTPFANSGMMVTLEPHEFGSEHALAGMELQRKYERLAFELAGGDYQSPIQTASDFLANRSPNVADKIPSSYQRGTVPTALAQVLPSVVVKAIQKALPELDQKWRGDFLKDATLVGPEMRGSSPLRMDRDRLTRESPGIRGLFPVGEGAGYAGGIISAAVDGLRSAREIVRNFAPLRHS